MPDGFDFSELDKLAADLGEVPNSAGPFINSALQRTAVNVKRGAAATVGKRRYFKQAAGNISYDVKASHGVTSSALEVEIGYDKGGAGNLGNLVEFGSPGDPSTNLPPLAPGNDLKTALAKNQDDFVKGLDAALKDAERKSGL